MWGEELTIIPSYYGNRFSDNLGGFIAFPYNWDTKLLHGIQLNFYGEYGSFKLPGDINNDNIFNLEDILETVQNCVLNLNYNYFQDYCNYGDLNHINFINVIDILLMVQILLGE